MRTGDASAPSIADGPRQTGVRAPLREWATRLSERLETLADAERDQLPLWLPVGLILGIACWFWIAAANGWAAFILVCSGLGLALLAAGGGLRWARSLAIFALAAAIGCALIWWRAESVAHERLTRPRAATMEAAIVAVEPLPARGQVRLLLAPVGEHRLPGRIRVTIREDKHREAFRPGATIGLRAYLMPPAPMALPGGYDFARNAWFQRIGATGRAIGEVTLVAPAAESGWRARLQAWRTRLSTHIRERVAGGAGAIAATLATGDRGAISPDDAEAMRRSGLAHLLSISGLHVTAVVGGAMLLALRLLALSPMLALRVNLLLVAAAAGALAGVAYTLLTGAQVPTVRACTAALIVLAGIAMGRDALTLRLIAAGAIFVLLLWPESLAGPSFQLSFAAVTAIVALHDHPRVKALVSRREESGTMRFGRILLTLFLTGLAVELALSPIALFHFHKTGLYGALANIIAIPLTTFVIMPAEALALLLDIVGLGAPFWWIAGASLNLLLALAHATSSAPGSVALMPAIPDGAYALIVAGGLWICLWRTRMRRLGLVPIALGSAWALATPPPDLLVTGDGRHLAVRSADGRLGILRPRAGDYVRSMLAEMSGTEPDFADLDAFPGAACSPDLCAAEIRRGGKVWRVLATRSPHFVRWDDMVRACAEADIVVSDRRLPDACAPRWLKADRSLLRRTGGLAISLGPTPRVTTVADRVGRHPWTYSSP
jgi:competence protein ComEC